MKKIIIYISSFIIIVSQFSCSVDTIRPSDEVNTISYSFSDYNALEVSNNFNAFVTFSNTEEKIEIEVNDNLQEHVIVKMIDGKLSVRLRNLINIRGEEVLNLYITTKNISSFKVSGDSNITLENLLSAPNVNIESTGDSNFYGQVAISNLNIIAKGDSKIDIYGNVDALDAIIQGDSKLDDHDLIIKNLRIRLSGDSTGNVYVSQSIDVNASGDSFLYYKGDAQIIHQQLTGGSGVIHKN